MTLGHITEAPFDVTTLRKGVTVSLHPATELWMRGVQYATVTTLGRKWIHLRHHGSGTTHKVSFAFARRNFVNNITRGE